MNYTEKLTALRKLMSARGVDAYIIPSEDSHQSEYVADHWKCRTWISGFTGSAGTAVVTADHLGLWTDSRYFLQAPEELEASGGQLHKLDGSFESSHIHWLKEHLQEGDTVGIDGRVITVARMRKMQKHLNSKGIQIVTDVDWPDEIWSDRPSLSDAPIDDFPEKYAGESREERLMRVRQRMRTREADGHFVSALDNIAWVLNIRGSDVEFNPLAYAFLYIGMESATLFIDAAKVPSPLREQFTEANVDIQPYEEAPGDFLAGLPSNTSVWIDPTTTSQAIYESMSQCETLEKSSPIRAMKAIKNDVEVRHIRHAMVKDGVALVHTFRWLESEIRQRPVKETELVEQLAHFRSQQPLYKGESFAAIAGFKENGAIVHYRAEEDKCAEIQEEGVLLVDSGGQYLDGTTDITRTFALGAVSDEFVDAYTRVLKGHIALAMAVFPEGTRGVQLDILARQYLWEKGMNFGHGTGHGVGFFLNVHEPPQGFVPNLSQRGTTPFQHGMFSSNEPGYYKEGEYGIRIENLVLAVEKELNPNGKFLCFDTLTLYPIALDCVDQDALLPAEKKWINDYHERVFQALAPQLNEEETEWLRPQCAPIS